MKEQPKYRSKFEDKIVPGALARGAKYEPIALRYDCAPRRYKPDLVLPNAIVVEIKGHFTAADRVKTEAVLRAFPDLELRFVFQAPNNKINPKSKTTYAAWCDARGLKWSKGDVPAGWYDEPLFARSNNELIEAAL